MDFGLHQVTIRAARDKSGDRALHHTPDRSCGRWALVALVATATILRPE